MEVTIPRSPLVDLVCEYLNCDRSGFFTFQNIWDAIQSQLQPHLLAGKVCQSDLVNVFDQLVRLELTRIVLHPPNDRTSDLRRPYVRAFVRQMLKRDAKAFPNSVFEILKTDPLSCALMKRFDGRHTITEHITEIQKEIQSGRLNITRKGVPIQADHRDSIADIVETTIQNLRKSRLVI